MFIASICCVCLSGHLSIGISFFVGILWFLLNIYKKTLFYSIQRRQRIKFKLQEITKEPHFFTEEKNSTSIIKELFSIKNPVFNCVENMYAKIMGEFSPCGYPCIRSRKVKKKCNMRKNVNSRNVKIGLYRICVLMFYLYLSFIIYSIGMWKNDFLNYYLRIVIV